jgi:hypothetical protein
MHRRWVIRHTSRLESTVAHGADQSLAKRNIVINNQQ